MQSPTKLDEFMAKMLGDIGAAMTGGARAQRFFGTGYSAHLVQEWLPAFPGVVAKLQRGSHVADVGCGHGASTILMARAFPKSEFVAGSTMICVPASLSQGDMKASAIHTRRLMGLLRKSAAT